MEKSVDLVHASWTTASGQSTVDPHGGAAGMALRLVDARRRRLGRGRVVWATHHGVHRSSGSSGVAGRLGCSGGDGGARWGVCSDVGEEERGMVSGAGCSGWRFPFYRGSERLSGGDNGRHRGRNGRRCEGDLSAVKLRFDEGNGCGLMVDGGGSWHLGCGGGTRRKAALGRCGEEEEEDGRWAVR
jgi:hypothetical protein